MIKRTLATRILLAVLLAGMLIAPRTSSAATCTWTGNGADANWSTIGNWDNCGGSHAIPQNLDVVVFVAGAARATSVDNIANLSLQAISVSGLSASGNRYFIDVAAGVDITLLGVATVTFNAPFDNSPLAAGPVWRVPLALAGPASITNSGPSTPVLFAINTSLYPLTVNTALGNVTLADTVSGDGDITKLGTGDLFLEGDNSFRGSVVISAGRVDAVANTALGTTTAGTTVAAGTILSLWGPITTAERLTLNGGQVLVNFDGAVSTGNINVTAASTIIVNYSGTGPTPVFTVNGAISGNAMLTKSGFGELALGGASPNFTGTLDIFTGTVTARSNTALGGTTGEVIVRSLGRLVLDGSVTIARPLNLNGGILTITTNGNSIAGGSVNVTAVSSINIDDATVTSTIGCPITGTFAIKKIGFGSLILSGASPTFTGGVMLQRGTLFANGSLPNTAIAHQFGVLAGTGTVGNVTTVANATNLVAGINQVDSIGILKTGALAMNAGSFLRVQLAGTAPGSGYHQIKVTGSVNLTSAKLLATLGFTPVDSGVFTIIDNDGTDPIVGTFDGLPEGGTITLGGLPYTISYVGGDGNDVTLSVIVPKQYFLSEGATGGFFDEDVLIANPNAIAAPITMTFLTPGGSPIVQNATLPARSRATVHVDKVSGLEGAEVSTVVASTAGIPLAVERSMFWDARYYAGHTGSSVDRPSQDWVFAEGSQGFFSTYVLLANANTSPSDVTLTFLREADTPVVKTVTVPASARLTIDCSTIPEIVYPSFGIAVHGSLPIVAERAMYFGNTPTRTFSGGNESAGVTAPATTWFLAEGATGGFFDTFVLLSNPQSVDAHVTVKFLLDSGITITENKLIPANQRLTINIEAEPDPLLQNAAVSTVVSADVPIVAERSMYWIGDLVPWTESHNSFGVVEAGTHWGLAEGRVGQAVNFHTYILLANPQSSAANVTVTFLRESGDPIVQTYIVPATSRFNIDVNNVSPSLRDENVGADIVVTNGVPIVVERSMYWDSGGVQFKGGTNATGVRLP